MRELLSKAWAWFLELSKIFAMPGALILIAWFVDGAVKEAQLRADNLKLAVGVLSDGEATAPLRKFAVDLLAASTPEGVELSDDLRRSLESGETVLPRIAAGAGTATITPAGRALMEELRRSIEEPGK